MSLLETVQGLIERTYDMRSLIHDVGRFLVGDDGYRRFYRDRPQITRAASAGAAARTLVRETATGLRASIYYPDRLIGTLERWPPQRGVGEENVQEFADFLMDSGERLSQILHIGLIT